MATCANVEDTAKDELMPRRKKHDRDSNCLRCKTAKGQIIIRHCVYCKSCFYPTVDLKFRRALAQLLNPSGQRRSKAPTQQAGSSQDAEGNLLLGFSGGIGSAILLDMVARRYIEDADENAVSDERKSGAEGKRRPSVWKKIRVAYVEQCSAYENTSERVEEVRRIVARYPEFELIIARLEDAFDTEWWIKQGLAPDAATSAVLALPSFDLRRGSASSSTTSVDRLRTFLAAQPTTTAVQYSIALLTRLLLQHLALATSSTHVLLGTSLTSLSVSLISGISQGGGFNVKEEREEVWQGVRVCRPLREVGMKECAAWMWWRRLEVVPRMNEGYVSSGNVRGEQSTIQRLTRDFIIGLEKDFPSTVSAIAKTCEKLEPKGGSSAICPMCQRPAQTGVQDWKAGISIRSFAANPANEATAPTTEGEVSEFEGRLCYPCHTSWRSRSTRSRGVDVEEIIMPSWVGLGSGSAQQAHQSSTGILSPEGRARARDSIKEFLLDEDGGLPTSSS
ncbi:hypothetical protein FRC04_006330 [Tulasnella sp. 424]|nr:hypothetical protein FRC04_006330 [Tulasnella sp. 424]KAG8980382.1 hypothetical protein FRC05_006013 [Tulasnella sp. 425]